MLSSKLGTWIRNGFWPFRTQRNARKLLEMAKFESIYLFQMKDMYFKLENMRNLNGQWMSSKFTTWKYEELEWAMDEFKIHYEFRTHHLDFKFDLFFSPSYEFKINLELNQILNSTIGDWVWVLKHVETSSQCLHPIQNASYSFRTHNFWRFLGCLWLFFVISGQ